jgi:hypothetical protein
VCVSFKNERKKNPKEDLEHESKKENAQGGKSRSRWEQQVKMSYRRKDMGRNWRKRCGKTEIDGEACFCQVTQ